MRFPLNKTSVNGISDEEEQVSEEDSGHGINDVMRFHINRCKKENESKREKNPEELTTACLPRKDKRDGGHTYMTAGKGSCRVFSCHLCCKNHLAERSSGFQWQNLCVGTEIVVHLRKLVGHTHLHPVGAVIVLWTSHGEELKEQVEHEERCQKHEGSLFELVISRNEIEDNHRDHEVVVGCVAEIEELIPESGIEQLVEHQRGLTSKDMIVDGSEDMVMIVKLRAELVGLRIPIDEHSEKPCRPHQNQGLARIEMIDQPHEGNAGKDNSTHRQHLPRGIEPSPLCHNHDTGDENIDNGSNLKSNETALFLTLKIF